jgi:hypothetical protein
MMKLRCIAPYKNGPMGLAYQVGDEFEPSPQLRLFLLADAPGCFEVVKAASTVEDRAKALDEPPADKAIKAPRAKK